MDPEIVAALYRCGAVPISDKLSDDERMYLRWIDGYNQHDGHDPSYLRPLAQIGDKGGKGFRVGCRRDQFLEELAKLIPEGVITFRKRVERIEEQPGNGRIILHFKDGTTAEADAGECHCHPHLC
jgi:salicylate hydroxylase